MNEPRTTMKWEAAFPDLLRLSLVRPSRATSSTYFTNFGAGKNETDVVLFAWENLVTHCM